MVRRFILATLAVALAVVWSASAQAATAPSAPQLATAQYVSPALLVWTPGADVLNVSQTVYRAPGACTDPPAAAVPVRTYPDNTTSQHFAMPGDGTWCFFISAADLAGGTANGPGLTLTIDTTPPTATVAVSDQAPGGVVHGTVVVSGTSADAVSGVASSVLRVGPVGACATGTPVRRRWNTTQLHRRLVRRLQRRHRPRRLHHDRGRHRHGRQRRPDSGTGGAGRRRAARVPAAARERAGDRGAECPRSRTRMRRSRPTKLAVVRPRSKQRAGGLIP